jgi:hypothetical protein
MQIPTEMAEGSGPNLKPNMYRIYLNKEATDRMIRICEKTEMGQTELLTKVVNGALRAIEENNLGFRVPLKFAVIEEDDSTAGKYRQTPRDLALAEDRKKTK